MAAPERGPPPERERTLLRRSQSISFSMFYEFRIFSSSLINGISVNIFGSQLFRKKKNENINYLL